MNASRGKGCLMALAGLVAVSGLFMVVRFYGGKWLDQYERPWAYSTTEPLLVGQWEGRFNDPDGVPKSLRITIDLPETDEERWQQARRKRRLRNGRNKGGFDGTATVTSRLGREDYEIYGVVDRQNDHRFSLNFDAVDGRFAITPNFYINDTDKTGNQWAGDQLDVRLEFAYHLPGRTWSNSADPRFSRKVPVRLHRVTNQ
ncbi:hypothetical protein [Arsenicibacter rosenii]|uniref:Uncharacterized protein n=1 Tax=Arsenicibacter rosenii TaxID=1750698 RepID=A0A1S2VCP7_9BACT|nr:hypothetical protein [Arsenicibacter rosenii]OIN56085.1 hypothetical protein BLX24_26880 [Arsenicibacter rosenii]